MRVEIDARPTKPGTRKEPYFAIRIFPETNKEMADLEWAHSINYVPEGKFLRISGPDSFHYCIPFKEGKSNGNDGS